MEALIKNLKQVINNDGGYEPLIEKTDKLLDYNLNQKSGFKFTQLIQSLEILGGTEDYTKLIIVAIRNGNNDFFEQLLDAGLDKNFINSIRFLTAKYKGRLSEEMDKEKFPFAWKGVNSKVVMEPEIYLEYQIRRNDDEELILKEDLSGIINLINIILEDICNLDENLIDLSDEIDREDINEISDLIDQIKTKFKDEN